ncbi:MAG: pyridoxal phosphate-dependent aminotransferase [Bifidobacteriaceae bacterium]|nr:pyridoxal phosphate-dependent aminotransferase [Bifidobacteriaceae bacterium]
MNAIARERSRLVAAGAKLTDLTDSNPTHCGLGSPAALEAVARAARRSGRYEPDPKGPLEAREALAERFGGGPDDYWLTASTSEAYSWVFAVLADPGEAVATPAPGYPLIEPLAALAGLTTLECRWHYLEPDGWCLDPVALARAAESGARAFVLVNPGNPTGAYVSPATARTVVEACQAAGAALIADEVFGPFHLEAPPTSLAGRDDVVTFAFSGLSKLLCAPQLKLAWIRLSGPARDLAPTRDALDQVADTFLSPALPVALALPELLAMSDAVVSATRARLAANLAAVRQAFGCDPYRLRRCEGGWSAILDLPPDWGRDPAGSPPHGRAAEPAVRLMREHGLAAHPGWFYDIVDRPALVLSLLPEPLQFEQNCARLHAALTQLGDGPLVPYRGTDLLS